MGKLVVAKERFVVQEVEIHLAGGSGSLLFIGRNDANDICLPSLRVSKRHASIQGRADGFFLTDLGSTNASLLNGQRLEPYREQELWDGDVLEVGPYLIHCELPERPRQSAEAAADTAVDREARTVPVAEPSRSETRDHRLEVLSQGRVQQTLGLERGDLQLGGPEAPEPILSAPPGVHVRVFRAGGKYFCAAVTPRGDLVYQGRPLGPADGPVELADGQSFEAFGHAFRLALRVDEPAYLGAPSADDPFADLVIESTPGADEGRHTAIIGAPEGGGRRTARLGPPENAARRTLLVGSPEDDDRGTVIVGAPDDAGRQTVIVGAPEDAGRRTAIVGSPEDGGRRTAIVGSPQDDARHTAIVEPPGDRAGHAAIVPPGSRPRRSTESLLASVGDDLLEDLGIDVGRGGLAAPIAPVSADQTMMVPPPPPDLPANQTLLVAPQAGGAWSTAPPPVGRPPVGPPLGTPPGPPLRGPAPPRRDGRGGGTKLVSALQPEAPATRLRGRSVPWATAISILLLAGAAYGFATVPALRQALANLAAQGQAWIAPQTGQTAIHGGAGGTPATPQPRPQGSPEPVTTPVDRTSPPTGGAQPGATPPGTQEGAGTPGAATATSTATSTATATATATDRPATDEAAGSASAESGPSPDRAAGASSAASAAAAPTSTAVAVAHGAQSTATAGASDASAAVASNETTTAQSTTPPAANRGSATTSEAAVATSQTTTPTPAAATGTESSASAAGSSGTPPTGSTDAPSSAGESSETPPSAGSSETGSAPGETSETTPPSTGANDTPPSPAGSSATVSPGSETTDTGSTGAGPGESEAARLRRERAEEALRNERAAAALRAAETERERRNAVRRTATTIEGLAAHTLDGVEPARAAPAAETGASREPPAKRQPPAGGEATAARPSSDATTAQPSAEAGTATGHDTSPPVEAAPSIDGAEGNPTGASEAAGASSDAEAEAEAAGAGQPTAEETRSDAGEAVEPGGPRGSESATTSADAASAAGSTSGSTPTSTQPAAGAEPPDAAPGANAEIPAVDPIAAAIAAAEARHRAAAEALHRAAVEASTHRPAPAEAEKPAASTATATPSGDGTAAPDAAGTTSPSDAATPTPSGAATTTPSDAETPAEATWPTDAVDGTDATSTSTSSGEGSLSPVGAAAPTATPADAARAAQVATAVEGLAGEAAGAVDAVGPAVPLAPDGRPLPAVLEPIPATKGLFRGRRDGAEYVFVPAGSFKLGNAGGRADERPVRQVAMGAFFIARYEVTHAQYRLFLEALAAGLDPQTVAPPGLPPSKQGYTPGRPDDAEFRWDKQTPPRYRNLLPVVMLDWWDAAAYARWTGGALPTEAQWERAASYEESGAKRAFPWGDRFVGPRAQVVTALRSELDNEAARDAWLQRGGFPSYRLQRPGTWIDGVSALGIFDLSGNVAEWCRDAYSPGFYATCPETDPANLAETAPLRTTRGGSWRSLPQEVTTTRRDPVAPETRDDWIGVRVVIEHP